MSKREGKSGLVLLQPFTQMQRGGLPVSAAIRGRADDRRDVTSVRSRQMEGDEQHPPPRLLAFSRRRAHTTSRPAFRSCGGS